MRPSDFKRMTLRTHVIIILDLCFYIIYQHAEYESIRCSLSKVIERPPIFVLCFHKRHITPSKISGLLPKSNLTCVLILYIKIPNLNWIDAVFQKLLSGHHILITDGRTDAGTHGQTEVTLNAPPPFFEWRGHKNHGRPWLKEHGSDSSQPWYIMGKRPWSTVVLVDYQKLWCHLTKHGQPCLTMVVWPWQIMVDHSSPW